MIEENSISEKTEGDVSDDDDFCCSAFNIQPQDGAVCCIQLTSSKPIKMKYPLDTEVDFTIGDHDSDVDEFISEALVTMKAGEVKTMELPKQILEEDAYEDGVDITVTLHKFMNPQPIFLLTNEQRFQLATECKSKGVELFKAKNIKYAFVQFSKALKYLISMLPVGDLPESLHSGFNTLRVQCYSNMAACQLLQRSYNYVVRNCTMALKIDPANVKCLYRRAEANFQLGKYDLCSNDVQEGLKCEPKSKSFQGLVRKVSDQAK